LNIHHSERTSDDQGGGVDLRQQLVNQGEIGPIHQVSLPLVMITRLQAIMIDVDLKLLKQSFASHNLRQSPARMYEELIRPMLSRHSVLAKAEVRDSGSGLHILLHFDRAVEFLCEGDRARWQAITRAIQLLLPSDPDAPGITAVTRPVGATNSKNGRAVSVLKEGEPITAREVLDLFEEIRTAPVRTVMGILLGRDALSPCPLCQGESTMLAPLDHVAMCYGGCGKVGLDRVYDLFMAPRVED